MKHATRSAATPAMIDGVLSSADTPIVFDCMQLQPLGGIEFDIWYCNTHVPGLNARWSCSRLRRYAAPLRSSYMIVGELQHMPDPGEEGDRAPLSPAIGHAERFVGDPLGVLRRRDASPTSSLEAAIVYPAFLRAPPHRMQELGRWYEEEHLPMLLSCPQWVMTRRFRIVHARGLDWTHLALHYLTDLRALQSPQRDAARNTSWRDSLKAEGWFHPEYRVCYRMQDF